MPFQSLIQKQKLLCLLLFLFVISCKKKSILGPNPDGNQIQVAFSAQTIGFVTVDSAIVFLDRANTPTVKQKMQGFNGNKFILETESLVTGEYDVTIRLYTKKDADNHSRVHIYKKKITLPAGKQIINAPSGKLMDATWRPNIILKDDAKGIIVIMAERQDDPFFEIKMPANFNFESLHIDRLAFNNQQTQQWVVTEVLENELVNGVISNITKFADYANAMKTLEWTGANGIIQFGLGEPLPYSLDYSITNRP